MKQYEENYLTMSNTTLQTVNKRKEEWNHVPRIVTAVSKLESDIEKANAAARESLVVTTGVTQDKADLIQQTVAAAVKLCKPACVYAIDRGDMALHDSLSVSRASLLHLRDMALLQRLNQLLGIIEPLRTHLVDYGVKEEQVTELQQLITRLSGMITQPRELTAERKSKKQHLSEIISELRKNLYLLDGLMKIFDPSELYTEYRNARIIVNLGKRSKKTGEPETPSATP